MCDAKIKWLFIVVIFVLIVSSIGCMEENKLKKDQDHHSCYGKSKIDLLLDSVHE